MKTQRQRLIDDLNLLGTIVSDVEDLVLVTLDRMSNTLADAQNAPPLGIADGSLNESGWKAGSLVERKAREFLAALEAALPKATW